MASESKVEGITEEGWHGRSLSPKSQSGGGVLGEGPKQGAASPSPPAKVSGERCLKLPHGGPGGV